MAVKKILFVALTAFCLLAPGAREAACLTLSAEDELFLDLVERKAFDFFWNEADPKTGLIKDQTNNFGEDTDAFRKHRASIASVGFGLSAYIVGVERGWITKEQAYERIKNTLDCFDTVLERDDKNLYYHWIDTRTNRRWMWDTGGGSEYSTIDTALFLCGAIAAGEYFAVRHNQPEFRHVVERIYRRIRWSALNDMTCCSFNEYIIITLLGIGSPENAMPPSAWNSMFRNYQYSTANRKGASDYPRIFYPSLFVHLFPQAWFDMRGKHDRFANYFLNSRNAVLSNRRYCLDHAVGGTADPEFHFATYGEHSWGLSACEAPPPKGYDHYGEGEPALEDEPGMGMRGIDGTVAIHAAGGSMPFTPDESLAMMKYLYGKHRGDLWGKYGFCDSYNSDARVRDQFNNEGKSLWRAPIVSGIDQGIILLMIENHRTGLVWRYFMNSEHVRRGMDRAGFVPEEDVPGEAQLDLTGEWAFKTGDEPGREAERYDDSGWGRVPVPARWEEHGYPDYDGIAWYRKKVSVPDAWRAVTGTLIARFGGIDDADEVYFNGRRIGRMGEFPPGTVSAWNSLRVYEIPRSIVRYGQENVIAVRVNDHMMGGGIWKGPVDICPLAAVQYKPLFINVHREWRELVNLEGEWGFHPGDLPEDAFDSRRQWKRVQVPSAWETQGFPDYDGIAVYRKEFSLEGDRAAGLGEGTALLRIGAVDDADVVYLNGKIIGQTGDFPPGKLSAWSEERSYEFPSGLLKAKGNNVIVIKVNDNEQGGGVVKGPVRIYY